MASRVVTPVELEAKYGLCDGFVPDVVIRVTDPRSDTLLREDYVRLDGEGTITYGFVPGEEDPVYAKPNPGPWQCLETYGRVQATPVSFRQIHVRDEEGWVYFIQVGKDGPYKIGWSQDVHRRIGELQVANPKKLHLRGTLPGTRETESGFHERFKSAHVTGEWFQNTEGLREFVKSLGKVP